VSLSRFLHSPLTSVLEINDRNLSRVQAMTREEIEERMDELARKYIETHDPEIVKQLYELARELEKLEKGD
jgi:hypothetical protein